MKKRVFFILLAVVLAISVGLVGCGVGQEEEEEEEPSEEGVKYDLTITSTSGGSVINPGEGTFTYDEGAEPNLQCNPDSGYQFVAWSGDTGTIGNVYDPTTTITMDMDRSIIAHFLPQEDLYRLTIDSTEGGYVKTPGEGNFWFEKGQVVLLEAMYELHNRFHSWTGDVDTIADIYNHTTTITMNAYYTITAKFVLEPS